MLLDSRAMLVALCNPVSRQRLRVINAPVHRAYVSCRTSRRRNFISSQQENNRGKVFKETFLTHLHVNIY